MPNMYTTRTKQWLPHYIYLTHSQPIWALNNTNSLLQLTNDCRASFLKVLIPNHLQLTAGILQKMQTPMGPNLESEFTRISGTWPPKQYFNKILSNLRHTEVWKPVPLLETKSITFLHWNPWKSSIPRNWEEQNDPKLLILLYIEPLSPLMFKPT